VYPNLSGTNAATSSALLSELQGQLSPETLANIRNAEATYGVTSGMPGSDLARYRGVRDIGLTTEQLQRQGLADYSSIIPTVSATQTVTPAQQAQLQAGQNQLSTDIAGFNAVNASAPNPASAGSYAQQLFEQYLNRESSPAGGTGRQWWEPKQTPGTTTSNYGTGEWISSPRYF
jgi:hypothetical protein